MKTANRAIAVFYTMRVGRECGTTTAVSPYACVALLLTLQLGHVPFSSLRVSDDVVVSFFSMLRFDGFFSVSGDQAVIRLFNNIHIPPA